MSNVGQIKKTRNKFATSHSRRRCHILKLLLWD